MAAQPRNARQAVNRGFCRLLRASRIDTITDQRAVAEPDRATASAFSGDKALKTPSSDQDVLDDLVINAE